MSALKNQGKIKMTKHDKYTARLVVLGGEARNVAETARGLVRKDRVSASWLPGLLGESALNRLRKARKNSVFEVPHED